MARAPRTLRPALVTILVALATIPAPPAAASGGETCTLLGTACASAWVDIMLNDRFPEDCGPEPLVPAACYRIVGWGGSGSSLAGAGRVTVVLTEFWQGNQFASPFAPPESCTWSSIGPGGCEARGNAYDRWLERGEDCIQVTATAVTTTGTVVHTVGPVRCP